MSGFARAWLALREPYDRRARNGAVLDQVAAAFADRTHLSVVDLACGTGSTLRAISARLPRRQDWHLVDNDADLLAAAAALSRPPEVQTKSCALDLAGDLEAAVGACDLVTASALLDLVSAAWIERLVSCAASRQAPVYIALSYDGRATVVPEENGDTAVLAAFHRHQHGDKGFGPALGPDAASFAVARFAAAGYQVTQGPADWDLMPADAEIQHAIIEGWAQAARESGAMTDIEAWLAARRAAIASGRSRLCVGHTDFFAQPMGIR